MHMHIHTPDTWTQTYKSKTYGRRGARGSQHRRDAVLDGEALARLGADEVALDDLEPLINIFLHILVVNKMFFELLCKFGAQSLDSVYLFGNFLADLNDFFVNISTQEMCSLGGILSGFLDVLR